MPRLQGGREHCAIGNWKARASVAAMSELDGKGQGRGGWEGEKAEASSCWAPSAA